MATRNSDYISVDLNNGWYEHLIRELDKSINDDTDYLNEHSDNDNAEDIMRNINVAKSLKFKFERYTREGHARIYKSEWQDLFWVFMGNSVSDNELIKAKNDLIKAQEDLLITRKDLISAQNNAISKLKQINTLNDEINKSKIEYREEMIECNKALWEYADITLEWHNLLRETILRLWCFFNGEIKTYIHYYNNCLNDETVSFNDKEYCKYAIYCAYCTKHKLSLIKKHKKEWLLGVYNELMKIMYVNHYINRAKDGDRTRRIMDYVTTAKESLESGNIDTAKTLLEHLSEMPLPPQPTKSIIAITW